MATARGGSAVPDSAPQLSRVEVWPFWQRQLQARGLEDCGQAARAVVTSYHEAAHAVAMHALGMAAGHVSVGQDHGATGFSPPWIAYFQPEVAKPAWVYRRLLVVDMAGLAVESLILTSAPTHYPPDRGDLAKIAEHLSVLSTEAAERERLRAHFEAGTRRLLTCWWPCVAALGGYLAALALSSDTLACVIDESAVATAIGSGRHWGHIAAWPTK